MKNSKSLTLCLLSAGCLFMVPSLYAGDIPLMGMDEIENGHIQIIDIRSTSDYLGWKNGAGYSGHITGAIDFPATWLSLDKSEEYIDLELARRGIDREKKTLIYDNGEVSADDYARFQGLGFTRLYSLEAGFNGYAKDGGKTEKLSGYQRYVSPQWLADMIDGKAVEGFAGGDYKIVEITLAFEKDVYAKGHIKGAINIDADTINHIPGPRVLADYDFIPMEKQLSFWDFPSDDTIKEVLENNGITKDTTVILYASEKATTAANRAALVMDYAGVKDIRLLNGGKVLWELEKRPLESGIEKAERVDFGAIIPQNPQIVYNAEQELDFIKDPNAVIASVRSWEEYLGEKSGYTYIGVAGDIAGSRFAYAGSNPYAMEDFRNPDNTMFNYKLVAERWKLWGITGDKTVSFHCGTGWRAAETYYIAKALGWKNTGVYVGGWYQWHKDKTKPVMKKGLPADAPESAPQQYFNK